MPYDSIAGAYRQMLIESTHPMIEVDGVMKHRNNSLGQPIHPSDEGIKNFHRWFGKSKMVDDIGRPLVYYHGTGKDFNEFSHKFTGGGVDQHGAGFYFTRKHDLSNAYASSHTVPVYLKVEKPLHRESENSFTRTQVKGMITSAPDHKESLENHGDISYYGYNKVLNDAVGAYVNLPKFHAIVALHNDFYGSGSHEDLLKSITKHTGHDGVSVPEEDIVTVFHPHQIKSAIGNNGEFAHQTRIDEDFEEGLDVQSTEILTEATHDGHKVELNKPFRTPGAAKKFAVYVKNSSGNVVVVRFGDPSMSIKRDDPEHRKSFRARHHCDTATDKTTPRYWSCRFWEAGKSVSELLK